MKRLLVLAFVVAFGLCGATSVQADPFTITVANDTYAVAQDGTANGIPTARDNNDGEPDIYQAVNLLLGTSYIHNYQLDDRFMEPDYIWQGVSGSVVLVGLTAGNSNTLGTYTDVGVGAAKTPLLGPVSGFGYLGRGTELDPFDSYVAFTSMTPFAWYLQSNAAFYYSESGLNPSRLDHMMSFALPELSGKTVYLGSEDNPHTFGATPYLITWEDLALSNGLLGDEDYDDMMYVIEFRPVPDGGATLMLLGGALVGIGTLRRKLGR